MDYELAKKLKDAGFPVGVSAPTLEEIIEACGDTFETKLRVINDEGKIENNTSMFFHLSKRSEAPKISNWVAGYYHSHIPELSWIEGSGPDPKTAMANLYLALHGKTISS